jgi:hypothetical protein
MKTQKLKGSERFSARNSLMFLRLFSLNAFALHTLPLFFRERPNLAHLCDIGIQHLDRQFA